MPFWINTTLNQLFFQIRTEKRNCKVLGFGRCFLFVYFLENLWSLPVIFWLCFIPITSPTSTDFASRWWQPKGTKPVVVEPWLSKRWLTNPLFWLTHPTSTQLKDFLCSSLTWGNDPIWRAYFSDGWANNHQLFSPLFFFNARHLNVMGSLWKVLWRRPTGPLDESQDFLQLFPRNVGVSKNRHGVCCCNGKRYVVFALGFPMDFLIFVVF